MKAILLLVLLCGLALAQDTTERGFPQVNLIAQNSDRIALSNSNSWAQFPQLKLTFDLAKSSLVFVRYTITLPSSPESHLVTRLVVDRVEDQSFRAITGNTIYHTNTVGGFISLDAGRHEVRVDYRTPGSFNSPNTEDWTVAILEVTY